MSIKTKRILLPGFIGVASVWFSTHAGGGFCTGRQETEFFVQYGRSAVFMPFIAMGILAVMLFFGWDFARIFKTYDYSKFMGKLGEPYGKLLSAVFEIGFLFVIALASAAGIAACGSLLQQLFKIPYLLGITITAIITILLVIFGPELVRRAGFVMSLAIIGVLLFVLFISMHPAVSNHTISTVSRPGWAWKGFLYPMFQAWGVGAYISVSDVLKTRKEVFLTALTGFLVNGIMLFFVVYTLLGYYPAVVKETLPVLYALQQNSSRSWIIGTYSFILFLGNLSTAVAFVYGGVKRYGILWKKGGGIFKVDRVRRITVAIIFLFVAWTISTFGLIRIVAKGYPFLGYLAIFIILPALVIIAPIKIHHALRAQKSN